MSSTHEQMTQFEAAYWSEIRLSNVIDFPGDSIIVELSPQHIKEAAGKKMDLDIPGGGRIIPLPFHLVQNPSQFN